MAGAAGGAANVLLTAGLVMLMATPILRVIVSLVEYVRMRDWFFVVTTVLVFGVLLVTVTLAVLKVKGEIRELKSGYSRLNTGTSPARPHWHSNKGTNPADGRMYQTLLAGRNTARSVLPSPS